MRDTVMPIALRDVPLYRPPVAPVAEDAALEARGAYWNDYYSRVSRKAPPSQFAAFVANEFGDRDLVVDVGCGNGRDTLFFAQLGFDTLGIDAAQAAIDHCRGLVGGSDRPQARNTFLCRNVVDLRDDRELLERLRPARKLVYSRFFLHAIDQHEEDAFFDFAFATLQPGDAVAVEFRTALDAGRAKVTAAHYRRYVEAETLVQRVVNRHGARVAYLAEGTGFAKYKADDAHVCRLVLTAGDA